MFTEPDGLFVPHLHLKISLSILFDSIPHFEKNGSEKLLQFTYYLLDFKLMDEL